MMDPESGYSVMTDCLSASECDVILHSLSFGRVTRTRAGARHLMGNPSVAELAKSDTLVKLASEWFDRVAIPFRATLFEKSVQTNWLIPWHQDTALPLSRKVTDSGWGPWSEKGGAIYAHAPAWALSRVIALRVHLDASTSSNGPLRVIPESHARGVLSDEAVMQCVSMSEYVECVVPRGGVIAMRPLLIHASSKAHSAEPRRVLHIEYADSLDLSERIQLAVL